MRVADLVTIYDYHFWATRRILDKATLLTGEQFTSPTRFPMGSLHRTLVHTLATEIFWLRWWADQSRLPFLTIEELPDLATIRTRWEQLEADLRAYLLSLRDHDLEKIVSHTSPRYGIDYTAPLWNFILHATYHGAQHRGEAAQVLTECGQSPGDMDIPIFLNERAT